METSQEHLEALQRVAQTARKIERLLSGTPHPGIDAERDIQLKELKKAVHRLDEVEGTRAPVGQAEKWQE